MAETQQKAKDRINYVGSARTFLSEVYEESKKVVWPSRETLTQSSLTVLVVLLALTVYMALADGFWNFIFGLLNI